MIESILGYQYISILIEWTSDPRRFKHGIIHLTWNTLGQSFQPSAGLPFAKLPETGYPRSEGHGVPIHPRDAVPFCPPGCRRYLTQCRRFRLRPSSEGTEAWSHITRSHGENVWLEGPGLPDRLIPVRTMGGAGSVGSTSQAGTYCRRKNTPSSSALVLV